MADPEFYIYVLFRETGVPFYVGKGKGDRWRESSYSGNRNQHKERIIRKMQEAGHTIPAVVLHEHLTEAVAFAYERALIAAIGRTDLKHGPLANQTDGGDGVCGWIPTPEYRAKLSAILRGRKRPPFSPEWLAKVRLTRKGKKYGPHSAEHRAKIGAGQKGNKRGPHSPEHRAQVSEALKGRKRPPRSAEWLANMSTAQKGKKYGQRSAEYRANLSAALKGKKKRPMSAEHRAKISDALRRRYASLSVAPSYAEAE